MHILLTVELWRLRDPRTRHKMTAPTHVKVLVLTQKGLQYPEYIKSVDTPNRQRIPSTDLDPKLRALLKSQIPTITSHLYHGTEHADYSDVGPLPDTRLHYWSENAWAKRTVICLSKYHVFCTLQKGETLLPNPWSGNIFSGDMFILKFPNTEGPDGRRFYEDIDPGTTLREILRVDAEVAAVFEEAMKEYFTRRWEVSATVESWE